jgi:ElaB/YqjD/DUF883 family membrane-anchored ribosome-binding protein
MASDDEAARSFSPIPSVPLLNGAASHLSNGSGPAGSSQDASTIDSLRSDVERLTAEKEALSSQYNTLLTKLNTMRTNVTTKLKLDAVRTISGCDSIVKFADAFMHRKNWTGVSS